VSTPASPKGTARVDPLIGALIAGKYKILKKIGEGGMGSVYIADQEPINRKVAIKVLLGKLAEDEVAVKRFEQEAKAISKMQHPNTVTIYDFGKTEDDRLYIVMEFLKGKTLTQVLREQTVLAPPRACKIMRQVCGSLADAHAAGIIHRDLKPDNIFLSEVGGDPDWVKVLDFGVAKLADSEGAGTLTQTGMIFGTPKYMSPEQAEGRPIDYRADIYALGVVMYELLAGRPPFMADTPVGLLLKHISEPPAPFSRVRPDLNIDPRVEAIVMKSLEKNPDRRQQMVSELANELAAFERAVTGQMPLYAAPGTIPTPLGGGLPTEVVPGTGQSPLTPAGLMAPNQVPPGLSISVPSPTKDFGLQSAQTTGQHTQGQGPTAASTAQHTAPQTAPGVMPFAPSTAQFTHGITHPIPAQGGGVDTLGGGAIGEISGGLHPPQKPKLYLYGAIGALAVAVVAAAVIIKGGNDVSVESLPVNDPSPATRTAPLPEPQKAVVEPKKDPVPPEPQHQDPPRTAEKTKHPAGKKPPRDTDRTTPRSEAPNVMVRVESSPSGARVTAAGKQIGVTPFETQLPRGDLIQLAFSKDGFQSENRIVNTDRDRQTVQVELKKAAAQEPESQHAKVEPKQAEAKKPPHNVTKTVETHSNALDEKVDDLK
jgi:serine/threonine protein kinase